MQRSITPAQEYRLVQIIRELRAAADGATEDLTRIRDDRGGAKKLRAYADRVERILFDRDRSSTSSLIGAWYERGIDRVMDKLIIIEVLKKTPTRQLFAARRMGG